ncbi:MAG: DsbC family protein [Fluviibacter phosphoraccumulans]
MQQWMMSVLAAAVMSVGAGAVGAQEIASPALAKVVESQLGVKPQRIVKTPYLGGLYEIYAGGQLFYSDEKGSVFVFGSLVDGKTHRNITAEQQLALLPLQDAIKRVNGNGGNGKRTLITFEDPNCGYCKKLTKELVNLKDATVYTFLVPILSEDSLVKSKKIWCAPDRLKAFDDWMVNGKAPAGSDNCANPLERNSKLAQGLGVSGTPAIFFPNGERVPGYIPLDKIEKALKGN